MTTLLFNSGEHIRTVVDTTPCPKHPNALKGLPCFTIRPGRSNAFGYLAGICGARIKKHGFTGKVSPASMSLKTPGGRVRPPKNTKEQA